MAVPDISAEVAAFRDAAYGEEVRGALIQLAQKLRGVITSELDDMSTTWNNYKDDMDKNWSSYKDTVDDSIELIDSETAEIVKTINGHFEGISLYEINNETYTTVKSSWQWYEKLIVIPNNVTKIYAFCKQYTLDTSDIGNKIQLVCIDSNGYEIGSIVWVSRLFTIYNVTIPSGTQKLRIRYYTNNGSADNTQVTVTFTVSISDNFTSVINMKNIGIDDARLEYKIPSLENSFKKFKNNLIDTNVIYDNNICVRNNCKTWYYDKIAFDVLSSYETLYVTYSAIRTDSGNIPPQPLRLEYKNNDSEVSYVYINQPSTRLRIPENVNNAELWIYLNNNSADNSWIEIDDLHIEYNYSSPFYKFTDDILKTIDPVPTLSRNLFNVSFSQSNIDSNNGHWYSTQQINTSATQEMINVEPNTEYALYWDWNTVVIALYVFEYAEDKTFISQRSINYFVKRDCQQHFTTGPNTRYIRLKTYSGDNTVYDEVELKNVIMTTGSVKANIQNHLDITNYVDHTKLLDKRLVVPDYYHVNNYLDNKIQEIHDTIINAYPNYASFIFITDIHWNINAQKSAALIKYITSKLKMPYMFIGGDIYDVWPSNAPNDCIDLLSKSFSGPIYPVIGNHEYKNYMNDATVSYYLYGNETNIVFGNLERGYYYVDDNVRKFRYIILNTYADNGSEPKIYFEEEQANWLRTIALNPSLDYKFVILLHSLYDINYISRVVFENTYTQDILSVLNSYNGSGEIICVLQGHSHIDRVITYNDYPVIITTCDKNIPWVPDDMPAEDFIVDRTSGTTNEQAFDVFVIDTNNRTINIIRIGAPALDGINDNIGNEVEKRIVSF